MGTEEGSTMIRSSKNQGAADGGTTSGAGIERSQSVPEHVRGARTIANGGETLILVLATAFALASLFLQTRLMLRAAAADRRDAFAEVATRMVPAMLAAGSAGCLIGILFARFG